MLKLTVAVLAIALAGSASAAGWRSLRIDASTEANFTQSVEAFKDRLTPSRRHAFERALQDILRQGTQAASAEQREYTRDNYLRQLDGLTYNEVVRIPDPTGELAQRYRAEYYGARAGGRDVQRRPPTSPWPTPPRSSIGRGYTDSSRAEAMR
jgi:hypothetical protein